MNNPTLIGYGVAAVIILLVIWLKKRRSRRPIRNKGLGILAPVLVLVFVFGLSIYSLTHVPGHPFHMPAYWELLCAGVIGLGLGSVMLYHTDYEKHQDGLVYTKPNKNFKFVIISVLVIRIALSQYFNGMDYTEFTLLTMMLAYVYICVWRIGSFVKFRRVCRQL